MKAYLEIDVPATCYQCRFRKKTSGEYSGVDYCDVVDGTVFEKEIKLNKRMPNGRAAFCPLRIEEESE